MSPENTLRGAVLISWTSLMSSAVVLPWEKATLAPPLREHLEAELSGPITPALMFGIVLLLVLVAASIGLLCIARWARPLFLWANLGALCLSPALGPLVMGPWQTLFNDIALMGFGVVIALTYFGDIKHRFRRGPA